MKTPTGAWDSPDLPSTRTQNLHLKETVSTADFRRNSTEHLQFQSAAMVSDYFIEMNSSTYKKLYCSSYYLKCEYKHKK